VDAFADRRQPVNNFFEPEPSIGLMAVLHNPGFAILAEAVFARCAENVVSDLVVFLDGIGAFNDHGRLIHRVPDGPIGSPPE
jgi:hypothetical protein